MRFLFVLFLLACPLLVLAGCPFAGHAELPRRGQAPFHHKLAYEEALNKIDWNAVKQDIKTVLKDSKDFWPADFGNYGPFMIRQAWHCAGSYRIYDGRGGCDGGRQRFNPELSWDDNTNLDKTKRILWPVKQKYGLGLSWGDLIILTGNTAIESMGGPVFGFCAGRVDDVDGSESLLLGPNAEQQQRFPCPVNGQCKPPLGVTTVGLIYVNPEGPMGQPIPEKSAPEIRVTFSNMNMNDMETVALIGGGHAFGRTHGACPAGPGPNPSEDPTNPWPGKCGSGKGKDAFTSGFDGPWTTTPTQWSNSYFNELLNNEWEVYIGPGGKHQWRTVNGTAGIMMLTTDISLLHDPQYLKYVQLFASNLSAFEQAFSQAWYKLTTRDMGPVDRCAGPWVPPPQPFQNPLPSPPQRFPDFTAVRAAIRRAMSQSSLLKGDAGSYAAQFVHLAHQCAASYRATDHIGGCNGARIRFSPEADFSTNVQLDKVLQVLKPVHDKFDNLSWADLIVLAGTVAVQEASGNGMDLPFCPGRTDASEGNKLLQELLTPDATPSDIKYFLDMSGMPARDYVALAARPRSASQLAAQGYDGPWTSATLSNDYFRVLLGSTWSKHTSAAGKTQYTDATGSVNMLPSDLALSWDPELLGLAQEFASMDAGAFQHEFVRAWTRLMNADRFDGPVRNVCYE